jgi:hypothetical protein
MGVLNFIFVLAVFFPCALSFSCMPCEDREGCITIPKGDARWDATQQESF